MKQFLVTSANKQYIVAAKTPKDAAAKICNIKLKDDSINNADNNTRKIEDLKQILAHLDEAWDKADNAGVSTRDIQKEMDDITSEIEKLELKDSKVNDTNIQDMDPRKLNMLESIAREGDAWWNKYQKVFDIINKMNYTDWKNLEKSDPFKYKLLTSQMESYGNEAKIINEKWNRALDTISRGIGMFGPKENDWRMYLKRYEITNTNSVPSTVLTNDIKNLLDRITTEYKEKSANKNINDLSPINGRFNVYVSTMEGVRYTGSSYGTLDEAISDVKKWISQEGGYNPYRQYIIRDPENKAVGYFDSNDIDESTLGKYKIGQYVGFIRRERGVIGGDAGTITQIQSLGKYVVKNDSGEQFLVPEDVLDYNVNNHKLWKN